MNDELIAMLAEIAMMSPDDINGDERLAADLGLTGTDLFELAASLEEELGEAAEDMDLEEFGEMTVEELCNRVGVED